MENVPLVLTSPLWPELVSRLDRMGYRSKWAKLDSSLFGSPQKRVRAFMLSRWHADPPDLPTGTEAPVRCIRDIMEPEVEDRYVRRVPLSQVKWRGGTSLPKAELLGRSYYSKRMLYSEEGLAPTVTTYHPLRFVSVFVSVLISSPSAA